MKFTSAPLLLSALLYWCYEVQAKAVFAHFMTAKLDAFALNIAYGDNTVSTSVSYAFTAANAKGFKLFFSFDYAGGTGPWPQADVLSYLTSYVNNGAYYHTAGGQPFVSTFEGPGNAADWNTIKAQTNAFFIPDYSSLGAGPALATGVADGLFNWDAWPWGNQYMNTFVDASYYQVLGKYNVLGQPGPAGKPYMMGVSPMFYTNLPGYDKNWLWNPSYLWFDRWQEVFFLQPDYVEIISWNDWGECHYIGPQDPTQWDGVFGPTTGKAAYNYADGFSHDGWRMMLPYLIDMYKTNNTVFEDEILVVWGSAAPEAQSACSTNGTTGNTASQLQIEFSPADVLQDQTFFWAFLLNDADFSLVVDGVSVPGRWISKPQSFSNYVAGFYMGVVDWAGSGNVVAEVSRGGTVIMSTQVTIPSACRNGITNYNMWTSYATHEVDLGTEFLIKDYTCVQGGSNNANFQDLCSFSCGRGYCPPGACNCELIGPSSTITVQPGKTPGPGYPVENVDFAGLCAFACGKGYCPSQHCTSVSTPVPTPTISPFNPDSCTGGSGLSEVPELAGLCSWACAYGYCPIAACQCSAQGPLTMPPPVIAASVTAKFLPTPGVMAYDDLCRFACERGNCPSVCSASDYGCVSGSGSGGYTGLCDFSCGRGFCPPPCTCSASGFAPTPTGYRANVTGYGLPGLADDFDPLCNFTCNHGYCPTGVCGQEISVAPVPSGGFATITGLESLSATPTYVPGALFEYDDPDPDDEGLSLEIMILNANDAADIATFTCTDEPTVPGTDGEALGCIAEDTAWLFWAIFGSGGQAEITTPDEYTNTRRRGSLRGRERARAASPSGSSNHSFHYHAEWHPSGNCSTSQCMLLANTPEGVWVPAGNGTSSSGAYHELHYIRSGSVDGYAAYRGGYYPSGDDAGNTTTAGSRSRRTLASRQYDLGGPSSPGNINGPRGGLRYYRDRAYPKGFFLQNSASRRYEQYAFVGASVEKTVARSLSSEMCLYMTLEEEREMGYMLLGPDATDDDAVAAAVRANEDSCQKLAYYSGCTAEVGNILESGIAEPEDPNDSSTELEEFEWELDCYIGGVDNSGDDSDGLIYPLEQRRKRSASEYLELLPPEMLEGLDYLDLDDDSEATRAHVYSLLEKRGGSRPQGVCKNAPGSSRKSVMAKFTSSPYRNVAYLVDKYGIEIFGLDGRTCTAGIQTYNSLSVIPKGMKLVAEHVMEIQYIKSFFQGMIDGLKPGGAALSTGKLSWVPFDQTNPNTATMWLAWSSILRTVPSQGTYVYESFYNALGTLSDTSNNLVLDSLTNGLKATIWAGAKNIVAPSKWNGMSHLGRLGTFNRIKAVLDYLNTSAGQNALSTAYLNIRGLCVFLTQALSTKNGITYDTKAAFTEFSKAQLSYMVTNVQNWITPKLAAEAAYWSSADAVTSYTQATANANLAQVQALQSFSWLDIVQYWLV